jgi:hypothetical protein
LSAKILLFLGIYGIFRGARARNSWKRVKFAFESVRRRLLPEAVGREMRIIVQKYHDDRKSE